MYFNTLNDYFLIIKIQRKIYLVGLQLFIQTHKNNPKIDNSRIMKGISALSKNNSYFCKIKETPYMKKNFRILPLLAFLAIAIPTKGQYDRAVVALTRLDYVYYNIDNPMSVSVPGLMPKDLVVYIGEDKAFIHRDPDGSNVNDFIVRPKDSIGTIDVHVDERLEGRLTKTRGIVRLRVITLPNPTLFLGYVREGDTVSLDDLLNKGYIQVKAEMEGFNFPLEAPEVLGYEFNRSESFQLPVVVEGSKLTQEVRNMLSKARRDETIYLEHVRVRLPDQRIVTLKAEFPLK